MTTLASSLAWRPLRVGMLAVLAWGCGNVPDAKPTRPSPPVVSAVASGAVVARGVPAYPTTVADLLTLVPREAVVAMTFPSLDETRKLVPTLDATLPDVLAALAATRGNVSQLTLVSAAASFDEASIFALGRKDGSPPDLGSALRLVDVVPVTKLLAEVGARKIDDVRYEGPHGVWIALLEGPRILVVGSRRQVVDAALTTLSGERSSFVDSPLHREANRSGGDQTGISFAVDLGRIAADSDPFLDPTNLFGEGSRLVGALSPKRSWMELDTFSSHIPRLESIVAPSSHALMERLPAGAVGAIGLALDRRSGRSVRDLVAELGRVDSRDVESIEQVFQRYGAGAGELDRALGSDIAIGMYTDPESGAHRDRFWQSKAVLIAVAMRDDTLVKEVIAAIVKSQSGSKTVSSSRGQMIVELGDRTVVRVAPQKGAVVFAIGNSKATSDLIAGFASQKNALGATPAFVAYRKRAHDSFAALFGDPLLFLGFLDNRALRASGSFGLDVSLGATDEGLALQLKGDDVATAVGITAALAVQGLREYVDHLVADEANEGAEHKAR